MRICAHHLSSGVVGIQAQASNSLWLFLPQSLASEASRSGHKPAQAIRVVLSTFASLAVELTWLMMGLYKLEQVPMAKLTAFNALLQTERLIGVVLSACLALL